MFFKILWDIYDFFKILWNLYIMFLYFESQTNKHVSFPIKIKSKLLEIMTSKIFKFGGPNRDVKVDQKENL